MLDEAGRKAILGDLPQFFETDPVLLRFARGIKTIPSDGLFRQRSPRPLREQHIFAEQLHAPGEPRLRMTVATNAHVARRDADHLSLVAVQELRRRTSGIDLDPERLRAR